MPGIQNVSFTAPDWQAEQATIERQRRLAELLQQQSMTPIDQQPTPAGGFTVPISPYQGLAKMLQAGTAGYGMHKADTQQKELAKRMGTERGAMLARAIEMATGKQAGTGQPDPQELSQAADQGTPAPQPYQTPVQPPNMAGAASMLMGSGDPVLSGVGGPMLAKALAGPESLFGKVDPKDYTAASVSEYAKTKNPAVLVPVRKMEQITGAGASGAPETRFVNPWSPPQQPIPQPVKQDMVGTGAAHVPVNPYTQQGAIASTVSPNAALSAQTAVRGQNMTDARAREALDQGKTQIVTDAAGNITNVNKGTNQASPVTMNGVPMQGKQAAITETQGKANLYQSRAVQAAKVIDESQGNYSPAAISTKQGLGKVWGVGGALEAGANVVLPQSAQKVEQAQRNFVNAILRQESGSAIAESEFANAQKQYFPQPGDAPQVIAQKKQNRETAIAGLQVMAGPAMKRRASDQPGAAGAPIDFSQLPQ